jgi:hypothetical protein
MIIALPCSRNPILSASPSSKCPAKFFLYFGGMSSDMDATHQPVPWSLEPPHARALEVHVDETKYAETFRRFLEFDDVNEDSPAPAGTSINRLPAVALDSLKTF